jgi:hypothetical protein
VVAGVGVADGASIRFVLRSLDAVLGFLSDSVDVPSEDESAGRVTLTKTPSGERFDWQMVFGNLLRVHNSPRAPKNAAVAVPYRGSWFYIDDSDPDSKSTFSLLADIFELQSGEIKSTAPVLTLPAVP